MMNERIFEYALTLGTQRVDRVTGIIHDCKICGLESSNGRTYPAETLKKAVPLYADAKVNVNHVRGRESRTYEQRIGSLANVRFVAGDGLRGDLRINVKHPLAEQLLWDAENTPSNVGLSHSIDARLSRGKDGHVMVEEIIAVESVDLVADPATTVGLFESHSDRPVLAGQSHNYGSLNRFLKGLDYEQDFGTLNRFLREDKPSHQRQPATKDFGTLSRFLK